MVDAIAELARRRAVELRRPRCRGAPVPGRLSRRCTMAARRDREELVRTGQVPPIVPADSRRNAAGSAGVGDLRGPRLLTDPNELRTALAEAARRHGFDVVGIARPDAIPQASRQLKRFLAAGAHGDMAWLETSAERRGDPRALWPDVRS